jgi:hypothetical protein
MNTLTIEVPDDLRGEIARRTGPRGMSESAWVLEAVREKLAADAQLEYLEAREAYDRVLAKVPAADPMPGDEL